MKINSASCALSSLLSINNHNDDTNKWAMMKGQFGLVSIDDRESFFSRIRSSQDEMKLKQQHQHIPYPLVATHVLPSPTNFV